MKKLIIAGFGGQGILLLGQLIAYSAMTEGKEVTWLPSYGPEMRGGTANCSVIISEKPIASPVISSPDILIAMNKPSLTKFLSKTQKGGSVFVNSTLIDIKADRDDINAVYVAASGLAHNLGTEKAANIYMLGAVNKVCRLIDNQSVYKGIEYIFSSKPKLIDLNKKIYDAAYNAEY
jgi:2-oxoglutarate ferredoxin oxidoreductase subunit gamma